MGILSRFADIVKSNVNDLLDKVEDPEKLINQYLIDMTQDLADVKKETAGVLAEQTRVQRQVDENRREAKKYEDFAKKALAAGNEDDARVFLGKKQELESAGAGLQTALVAANENASKMKQLHDKLVEDINELRARQNTIKAKAAVAKTQEKVNKFKTPGRGGGLDAMERLEDKIDKRLDTANAMTSINDEPVDAAEALEDKYETGSAAVDDELAKLKASMGIN